MGKKDEEEDEDGLTQGNNTGESLLPSTSPSGLGFFGSSYDAADQLPRPSQIGVRDGDSLGSVIDAVKGVAYYTDAIGFGESTNILSRGMGLQPLGINYFMNTGQTCSNGATMYQYFEGIPTGNAMGKKVGLAMSEQGIALKGLVPGMMEDVQSALNPMPLLNAMLGSGYPQCKEMTAQVGDMNGRIADPETKEDWIEDPDTAFNQGGLMYQTRWVLDTDEDDNGITLSRDEWINEPKTQNPDGTPLDEPFTSSMITTASTVAVVTILLLLGYGLMSRKIR
jgi:hypothetical protein